MTVQSLEQSPASILKRIDTIVGELLALRQEVQSLTQQESGLISAPKPQTVAIVAQPLDLVDELYGSLGQGSWTEVEQEINSKWERFEP
jgi:hypothetical protein